MEIGKWRLSTGSLEDSGESLRDLHTDGEVRQGQGQEVTAAQGLAGATPCSGNLRPEVGCPASDLSDGPPGSEGGRVWPEWGSATRKARQPAVLLRQEGAGPGDRDSLPPGLLPAGT